VKACLKMVSLSRGANMTGSFLVFARFASWEYYNIRYSIFQLQSLFDRSLLKSKTMSLFAGLLKILHFKQFYDIS